MKTSVKQQVMKMVAMAMPLFLGLSNCGGEGDSPGDGSIEYPFTLSKNGVNWHFDQAVQSGTFANGDFWVVGPANIVGISNDYHVYGFSPRRGQDGAMVNPGTDTRQGYDDSLASYDETLDASYPEGQEISVHNPLRLVPGDSLVTSVSWLYSSEANAEPGCPSFNDGTGTPRPVLRAAAVLTCLDAPPPEGSFRPPYVGNDKSIRFNQSQLRLEALLDLDPEGIAQVPDVATTEDNFSEVWLDHVHEYLGSYLHPTANIPVSFGFGARMAGMLGDATLLLNLDFSRLAGAPSKHRLTVLLVQVGIDLAGIADNGGDWPPNGGHNVGRKWPILLAGLLLDDSHMRDVGHWTTLFHEDAQTFYVTQEDVNRTTEGYLDYCWEPDSRNVDADEVLPFTAADIGLAEWGIRHATEPCRDNKHFESVYRDINGVANAGFVLAARLMGAMNMWNHDALFEYQDRWWSIQLGDDGDWHVSEFARSMWTEYRSTF